MSRGADRQRYGAAVRSAAVRLVAEDGLTYGQAIERLESDHGIRVPTSTLGQWVRTDVRSRELTGDPIAEAERQRGRLLRITAVELERLERARGAKDLATLERLARILRSMNATPASTDRMNGKTRRTLADLATGADESEDET